MSSLIAPKFVSSTLPDKLHLFVEYDSCRSRVDKCILKTICEDTSRTLHCGII